MNSETLCSLPSCSPFRFLTFKAHKRWERLDDFLLHSLNNYEKSPNGYSKLQIKKWIEQPRVFIHQKRVKRNSKIINRDTSVDFLYPETALKTLSDKIPILFEDEHYIAINKPSGLASQSTKNPEDPHCLNLVKFYLNLIIKI